jgi:hypothetical protein
VNGGLGSQADSLPQIVRRAAMRSEAVAQIVSKRSSQSGQKEPLASSRILIADNPILLYIHQEAETARNLLSRVMALDSCRNGRIH